MKRRLLVPLAIVSSILCSVFATQNTYANDILNVVSYHELYNKCYSSGIIKSNVGNLKNGISASSLVSGDGDHKVILTTGYGHSITDNDLSCKQLVAGFKNGKQSWTGLFTGDENGTGTTDQSKAKSILTAMGYKSDGSAGGGMCTWFVYKSTTESAYMPDDPSVTDTRTHQVCVTNVNNGKFTSDSKASVNTSGGNSDLVQFELKDSNKAVQLDCAVGVYGDGGCSKHSITNGGSWESFKSAMYKDLEGHRKSYQWSMYGTTITYELKLAEQSVQEGSSDDIQSNWVFIDNSKTKAALKAITKGGFAKEGDLRLSEAQKTTLHQHYFKTFFGASVICKEDNEEEYNQLTAADSVEAKNIKSKTCRAKATKNKTSTVHGAYKDGSTWNWHKDYTFEQLVNLMTEDELLGAASFADPEEDEDSKSKERDPDCYTKAGALGWIVCPTIALGSDMVENVYTGLIEPYLSIDAALFDVNNEGGAAVRNVWSIFQGFANLAFVIVFLFVIFSQLTGVGIDNYGIKKVLPKLIIGAVLINLSYIICQLAVDLSNILGRAVGAMFRNFSSGIDSTLAGVSVNLNPEQSTSVTKFAGVETGMLVVVGIAACLGVGAFLAAGPAILIPALLSILSLAVGILFLFLMLAVRQAVAVILVVVSPLAFAAYMLPNTKKMFDKWFDAFKGMLIAYPICAALVYGGDFVSKILLVTDSSTQITSLGIVLSAAAVAIAPIFFIPSVIKKGMAGIAGLSNMINKMQGGVNAKVQSRAGSRLNNSRLTDYQTRRQQNLGAKRNAYQVRQARKRLEGKTFRGRAVSFFTGGERNGGLQEKIDRKGIAGLSATELADYQNTMGTLNAEDSRMTKLYSESFATMNTGALQKELEKMGSSGKMDANMVQAAIGRIGEIDQGEATRTMAMLSGSSAFKNMDGRDKNRMIQTALSQKGNTVMKAYGKALGYAQGKNLSMEAAAGLADHGMASYIQGMGNDVFADMDKDVMDYISKSMNPADAAKDAGLGVNIANMFSHQQMAAGFGQGFSGTTGQRFNAVVNARSSSDVAADLQAMTSNQLAHISNEALTNAMIHALPQGPTPGGGNLQEEQIRQLLKTQIEDLGKEQNAQLVSNMNGEVRSMLGVGKPTTSN